MPLLALMDKTSAAIDEVSMAFYAVQAAASVEQRKEAVWQADFLLIEARAEYRLVF